MATEMPIGLTDLMEDIACTPHGERIIEAINKGCVAGGAGENNFLVACIAKEVWRLEDAYLGYATIEEMLDEIKTRLADVGMANLRGIDIE